MAHLPVNHPVRPLYRTLSGAIGCYIIAFGAVGLVQSWGMDFFHRGDIWALGLRTNVAFSVLSILAGAVLLGATLYGRNVDHFVYLAGAVVFLVAGLVMMAVLHTQANLLNFAITNTIVSFLIGLALLLAGLYGKSGPADLAAAEERVRHGEGEEEELKGSGSRERS